MYPTKIEERNHFLEIRKDYIKNNGVLDFMRMARYFQERGTPVGDLTLRKWDKKYRKENNVENPNEIDKELIEFIEKIGRLAERNPQYATLYARLKGYTDRPKEVSNDITPDEYIRAGIEIRESLRQEFKTTGSCPLCGFSQALCDKPRLDTKPEQSENREVATLAIPS